MVIGCAPTCKIRIHPLGELRRFNNGASSSALKRVISMRTVAGYSGVDTKQLTVFS